MKSVSVLHHTGVCREYDERRSKFDDESTGPQEAKIKSMRYDGSPGLFRQGLKGGVSCGSSSSGFRFIGTEGGSYERKLPVHDSFAHASNCWLANR